MHSKHALIGHLLWRSLLRSFSPETITYSVTSPPSPSFRHLAVLPVSHTATEFRSSEGNQVGSDLPISNYALGSSHRKMELKSLRSNAVHARKHSISPFTI